MNISYTELQAKLDAGEGFAILHVYPDDDPFWQVFDPREANSEFWSEEGGYPAWHMEQCCQLSEAFTYSEWSKIAKVVTIAEYEAIRDAEREEAKNFPFYNELWALYDAASEADDGDDPFASLF